MPPRIAVTWADSAASHTAAFHEELAVLTANAAAGLEAAGASAVVLDSAAAELPRAEEFDGVLVMGGGDVDPALYGGDTAHPSIDGVDRGADDAEVRLVRGALAARLPVLGICRGLQLVNVALGGTLIEDLGPTGMHDDHDAPAGPMPLHDAVIAPGTLLASALGGAGTVRVVSGHHQAAGRIGEGLRVSAEAPDGVVEAIESTDPGVWLLAVQWHPEDAQTRTAAPGQLEAILGAFVTAAGERAESRTPLSRQRTP
ncbi:hypothetical protein GCM10012320_20060 [Sinomonas cellulolyticus]|nr:hypothetical protein GCM10012320_20060 [Sinomonas sp. KCTC 49339]